MKKIIFSVAFSLIAGTAYATPITVNVKISSQANFGILASSVGATGDTSIDFTNTTFGLDQCSSAALCGTAGVSTVTGSATTFTSGTTYTFTFSGGTLTYVTSIPISPNTPTSWSLNNGNPNYFLNTTGTFHSAGFDDTPGTLNFSWPGPASDTATPFFGFNAAGNSSPIPEPGSFALFGSGLIGLGMLVRRRNAKL